ncbi:MAG: response regulator [Clostridiales bacterium]|nr:response regulator [Candidatus Crickella equi]
MKTSIAVLDSNHMQRLETLSMLEEYSRRRRIELSCDGYASGLDLLKAIDLYGHYDIYILETDMPDINGFYIARELRARYSHCKIIYYTANKTLALNAFEVRADNYVIKPASAERFDTAIDGILDELESDRTRALIEVKTRMGFIRIATDDIAYVNIDKRCLCYHLKDGSSIHTILLREPFKTAVEGLMQDPDFCIAGASLLINLSSISIMNRHALMFNHGEWISPPRASIKTIYLAWKCKTEQKVSAQNLA